ncbi:hypothetical protein EDB84DRAFT_1439921 [Lactarius hengduanensis]|nr:hypothetical protein EDB84DRAFT_1439921 [Lactarius hengduanensis]
MVARPPTHTYRPNLGVISSDDNKREEKPGKPPAHPLIRTKEKLVTPLASPSVESESLPVTHPPSRTYNELAATYLEERRKLEGLERKYDDNKRKEKLGKPPAHPLIRTKEKLVTPLASPSASVGESIQESQASAGPLFHTQEQESSHTNLMKVQRFRAQLQCRHSSRAIFAKTESRSDNGNREGDSGLARKLPKSRPEKVQTGVHNFPAPEREKQQQQGSAAQCGVAARPDRQNTRSPFESVTQNLGVADVGHELGTSEDQ